jgi:hypothetical protein
MSPSDPESQYQRTTVDMGNLRQWPAADRLWSNKLDLAKRTKSMTQLRKDSARLLEKEEKVEIREWEKAYPAEAAKHDAPQKDYPTRRESRISFIRSLHSAGRPLSSDLASPEGVRAA